MRSNKELGCIGTMSKQEILAPEPPERDPRGRFQTGGGAPNPNGRPAGVPNQYTQEIRDMVREALEGVGGVNYLMLMAVTRPDLFLPLVGRTLPLKLQSDPGAAKEYIVSERLITDPPKK